MHGKSSYSLAVLGMKMHPPYFITPIFGLDESAVIFCLKALFLLRSAVRTTSGGKERKMKLRIRYENELQYLELNAEDTERLWISLSLEGEGLSQAERENRIEEFFEEQFNRPEYNNWHKETRRIGNSKARPKEDNGEVEVSEPLMSEVIDDRIFMQDEIRRDEQEEYEEVCDRVRTILAKKPHWAEAFIAVRIDGVSVNDHAASIGVKDASIVSKWLSRAEKKLREKYRNRQI